MIGGYVPIAERLLARRSFYFAAAHTLMNISAADSIDLASWRD
jgi:hypothetical protein